MSVPNEVDLSKYLTYIRAQGGVGCWGYALLSIWKIMNEIAQPYSPDLSMKLWLVIHSRRDLWEKYGGIIGPNGQFHKIDGNIGPEFGFFQSFGNPTEGTEIAYGAASYFGPYNTLKDLDWTDEGVIEASNYKLKGMPNKISLSSSDFINAIAKQKPIRIGIGPVVGEGHVIAIVGYNKQKNEFKYVNSYGSDWENSGFSTFTFSEIDNKKISHGAFKDWIITDALTFDIIPPKPVPVARISLSHGSRADVQLWLSAEGSPRQKKKIWDHSNRDNENSRVLSYNVTLPSEFIWPPSDTNQLVLDLQDIAKYTKSGGTLNEFFAYFGGNMIKCSQLDKSGPIKFNAGDHLTLHIP